MLVGKIENPMQNDRPLRIYKDFEVMSSRVDAPLLIASHAIIFWLIATMNPPLAHDTLIWFHVFSTLYSGLLLEGEASLWLPHIAHGITSDLGYFMIFTPELYLSAFLGKLGSVTDTLLLFRFGIYLQEVIFVYGLFKLSRLLHSARLTAIILAVTGALSINWAIQIHINFYLIYAIPLILYFSVRFFRGNGLEWAIYALITLTLAGMFYAKIFNSFILAIFGTLWIIFYKPKLKSLFQFRLPMPLGPLISVLALSITAVNAGFAIGVLEGMSNLSPNRNSGGTVSLDSFLTYGGHLSSKKFLELFYGASVTPDFQFYAGLFSLLFLALALARNRVKALWIFLIPVFVIALFSLGGQGGIATLAYWYFPAMDKFRHVGYVLPLLKVFLIIASGFGVDWFLNQRSLLRSNLYFLLKVGLILLFAFFIIDAKSLWQYSYDPWRKNFGGVYFVPFWFHYIQLGLVLLFLTVSGYAAKRWERPNRIGSLLLIFVVLQIGCYKYLIETNAPWAHPSLRAKWDASQNLYIAKPYVYPLTRELGLDLHEDSSHLSSSNAKTRTLLSEMGLWWGAVNGLSYEILNMDLCLPLHRTAVISLPLRSLLTHRTGQFVADQEKDRVRLEFPGFTSERLMNDRGLMRALGCGTPKLYLAHTPVLIDLAGNEDGDGFIENTETLYETPLIQTRCDTCYAVYVDKYPDLLAAFNANPSGKTKAEWGRSHYLKHGHKTRRKIPTHSNIGALTDPKISTQGIEVTHFSANRLIAKVNAPEKENNFLIYLDSFHPGWTAKVDGKTAEILPANIAFKAVELTPGVHEVVFEFTGGSKWSRMTIWTNFIFTVAGSLFLLVLALTKIVMNYYRKVSGLSPTK